FASTCAAGRRGYPRRPDACLCELNWLGLPSCGLDRGDGLVSGRRQRGVALAVAAGGEQEDRAETGNRAEAEGDQRDDVGDLGDLPPAVGVQQHAAQRLAL